MPLSFRPLSHALGAEVQGVDLVQPLSNSEFDQIHRTFLERGILLFRDQKITREQHIAFSRRFGELDRHDSLPRDRHPDYPELLLVTNILEADGKPSASKYTGHLWHSDMSFTPVPSLGSLLRGITIPPQTWGPTVVADNRAGANGVVAGEIVAKAPGDGYTLSVVAMGHAINPLIYKKLPYDGDKDFTPISLIATFPQLVLVKPALKAGTLGELLALAKSATPPITYASGGNGSSQHLAGALLAHMAGVSMTHVAYKGGNPAQVDLMAGNVDMMITQPNSKDLVTT